MVMAFVYEGFIREDRSYDFWEKGILLFLILFCLTFGLWNSRKSYYEDIKELIIEGRNFKFLSRRRTIQFRVEDIKSYSYCGNGFIKVELTVDEKYELVFDSDMKNFSIFQDILIENEEILLTE